MSWFDSDWGLRLPVSINNLSGSGTIDSSVQIGPDVALFWDNVRGDGFDVRVTDKDGITPLAYNRQTWNYSSKLAQFDVDSISAGNSDATVVIFLYFGKAAATDGSTSPTISGAKTGSIQLAASSTPVVVLTPFRPGETVCQQRVTKTSAEEIDVWVDCRRALQSRVTANQDSLRLEEISYVTVEVLSGGTDDAGRYDESLTRISDPGWAMVRVKGGSSGSNYTLSVTIGTSLTRVLQARAIVDVQDIDES